MMLELADNGERGGRGLVNRAQQITLPCSCINGKIAYVQMPDGTWMRADIFNHHLSDNGYELSGFDPWTSIILPALKGVFGGSQQQSAPAPPVTVNIPGQQSGSDMLAMLMGMIMGNRATPGSPLPGISPAAAPAAALPAPMPRWIVPAAVGAGIFLLTFLISSK